MGVEGEEEETEGVQRIDAMEVVVSEWNRAGREEGRRAKARARARAGVRARDRRDGVEKKQNIADGMRRWSRPTSTGGTDILEGRGVMAEREEEEGTVEKEEVVVVVMAAAGEGSGCPDAHACLGKRPEERKVRDRKGPRSGSVWPPQSSIPSALLKHLRRLHLVGRAHA